MIYGITPSGFVKMRLPEIRLAIISRMTTKLSAIAGKAVTVETSPNSVSGALIDTFAEREAALWERMEAQYYAMYPHTSEGINQDNAVAFTGVERLAPSKSSVYALVHADNNTVVPAGTEVRSSFDQTRFELVDSITVSQNAASAFRIEVAAVTGGALYVVSVNGTSHNYNAPPGVSATAIINSVTAFLQSLGLVATIASSGINVTVDGRNAVSVGVSPNLTLSNIESAGLFRALENGPFEVPVGAITSISSPNPAVKGVRNLVPGTTGRNRETDSELQSRYVDGPFRLGKGTLPAIRANLWQNVPGITDLDVSVNEGESTDSEGRPAGSIEVIVRGGDDTALRNEIFRVKGAGTRAYGLSVDNVIDEEGEPHPIGITRPSILYVWVAAKVSLKAGSSVTASIFQQMQEIIVEVGRSYSIGENVIRQKFIGPLYELTDAIAEIELTLYSTANLNTVPNLNDYAEENIVVGARQLAVFSLGRVTVY